MAAALVLLTGAAPGAVLAASNGIYIAAAMSHYRHPVTGVIEDSGGEGSAVLGQSMTESAVYDKALVEVDPQGNTYVTVRLQLMDNIQDPQFQADGQPVEAALMQENYGETATENTADYRMQVGGVDSVIRCEMFVTAMGRQVIFYITVSDLQPGSGDFISSVEVAEPPAEAPSDSPEPGETSEPAEAPPENTPEPTVSDAAYSDSDSVAGLQEFDRDGNKVSGDTEAGEAETAGNGAVWKIAAGTTAGGIVLAGVWYFARRGKKS